MPLALRRLISFPVLSFSESYNFIQLRSSIILNIKNLYVATKPLVTCINNNFCTFDKYVAWILARTYCSHILFCIIAQISASAHLSLMITVAVLCRSLFWSTLTSDVHTFVFGCIQCLFNTGGTLSPCVFGPSLHGTSQNALVYFDDHEFGTSRARDQYSPTLRNNQFY